jgi:hypothetical protein
MSDVVYDDESKYFDLLSVLREVGLFGGVIVERKFSFDSDELLDDDESELAELLAESDRQDTIIGKYAPLEAGIEFYNHYGLTRSVIDITPSPEPSQHDWVSPVTLVEPTYYNLTGIRHEFLPDDFGANPADRPSENFWLLPGIRTTEDVDVTFARWTKHNVTCKSCFILTPKRESSCQNCDAVLV